MIVRNNAKGNISKETKKEYDRYKIWGDGDRDIQKEKREIKRV